MIANTLTPPYYAVIFTSIRSGEADEAYANTAKKMAELAAKQPGFLGVESARNEIGITVSYWESLEAIRNWKADTDHLMAQQMGKELFYTNYKTRIAKVERDYGFER
jgi:heme-degrading monooxygenase HmoA